MARPEFDVVVVGGGSAGCAAASRLSSTTDLRVCLVEAGPDYGSFRDGRWPAELLDPCAYPATHDWGYSEERPAGSTVPESRAKLLGGCSAHNQCAALWPPPEDFDAWASSGNPGWRHRDLTPLIAEVTAALAPVPPKEEALASWQRVFLETAVAAGFPRIPDLSSSQPEEAVAPFPANIRDGVRWNAAFAFLDAARGLPNLTILDETVADRLLLQRQTGRSLRCLRRREELTLNARAFVLCAGTYGSPMILMRSGIGPAAALDRLGIEVVRPLPGVGENLHDHYGVWLDFVPLSGFVPAVRRTPRCESQVILRGRSRLRTGGFDLHLLPFQPREEPDRLRIGVLYLEPRSRGRVQLRSADPSDPPRIDFRFLSDLGGIDLMAITDGLRLVRRLGSVEPLASLARPPGVVDVPGEAVREDDLRKHLGGYSHPVGTCRMGPATEARTVVDAEGSVHGLTNVFVADASIIPDIPRANINLICMLIGMKAAGTVAAALRE